MPPAASPAPAPDAAPPTLREAGVVAALGTLVAALFSLRPFAGSELRYVDSASAMLHGGDWVVPHLAGVPYMEKPILFYWLSAGAQWLLGSSNVVVRAPSIAGTVAMFVVTYALAFELRGRTFARGAAGLLLGSVGFVALGTSLTTDPLFAGALAVTWYCLWRHLREPASGWKWGFWTAAAAALLSKGPLGPAMVVASCLVLAVAQRRIAPFWSLRPFLGVAYCASLCLPWHVALWLRDPRLVEFFYVRQNVRAAVDAEVNHAAPVYYYVPVLLALLFPFSVLVVTAVWRAVRGLVRAASDDGSSRVRLQQLVAAVVIGPLLLLTASASKLGTYVLPLLPFLAVLVAAEAALALERPGRLLRIATGLPALALVVAAGIGVPRLLVRYDLSRFGPLYVPMLSAAVVVLLSGLVAGAWLGWRGRRTAFVPMGGGLLLALALAAPVAFDEGGRFDVRFMARRIAPELQPDDVVVVVGGNIQDYSVQIELGRRIAILGSARELGMGHFVECRGPEHPIPLDPNAVDAALLPESPWLLDDRSLRALWEGPRRVWLFGEDEDVAPLRRRSDAPVHTIEDDGKHVLYSNRP